MQIICRWLTTNLYICDYNVIFGSTGHIALDVIAVNWFNCDAKIDTLILQSCPGADVEVLLLDLKSLESIRNCASEFKSRNQALHLLVRPPESNLILIWCLVLKLSLYLNLSRQFNIPLNPMYICIDNLFNILWQAKQFISLTKNTNPTGPETENGETLLGTHDETRQVKTYCLCFNVFQISNSEKQRLILHLYNLYWKFSLPIGREHPQIDIFKNLLSSYFLLCSTRSSQYSPWFISRWIMLGVVMALPGTQLEALEGVLRYCKSLPDFTCLWLIFGLHGWIIHFGL